MNCFLSLTSGKPIRRSRKRLPKQSALDSATALGDLEPQAAAHAELSELKSNREDHLKMAINLYEELGDEMMANELREELP